MTILSNSQTDRLIRETLERKADEYFIITHIARNKQDDRVKQYLKGIVRGDKELYVKYWQYYCQRKGE